MIQPNIGEACEAYLNWLMIPNLLKLKMLHLLKTQMGRLHCVHDVLMCKYYNIFAVNDIYVYIFIFIFG